MAVFGALAIGASGLNSQSAALSVIGNNIANVSTTGFKGSRTEFADLLSASGGGELGKIGLGTRVGAVRTLFGQGAIEATGRDKDLAIDGEGFFLVGDPNAPLFTRAGNFTSDANGDIVTPEGLPLLAFPISQTTGQRVGTPTTINTANLNSQAQATTNATVGANLDANGAIPTGGFDSTSFANAYATATHPVPVQVFDSLGGVHTATVFFTRTGTNAWRYDVAFDAGEVSSPAPGALGPGDPMIVGNGTITFNADGSLGTVTTTNPSTITFTGANAQTIDFDFGTSGLTDGLSQNASPFSLRFSSQDGFGVGELKGVNFTEEGFVEALFSNGESRVIGQLALARFPSPEGLLPLGDQLFQQSADSGVAVVDVPLNGGRGGIVGGSLENSNVSIADEFIRLIEAQRGFQANTRVITASDQLLNDLVNIIR